MDDKPSLSRGNQKIEAEHPPARAGLNTRVRRLLREKL